MAIEIRDADVTIWKYGKITVYAELAKQSYRTLIKLGKGKVYGEYLKYQNVQNHKVIEAVYLR